jgi:TRAP-type uncharacterized transport system fused permease subunit
VSPVEATAAGPTTRSALLLDTVWTITSHTGTSTAAAVRDIELDPRGEISIMVTTTIAIMAIRATMAALARRSTTMHARRSSILIVRHRRHVQHLRSQPARAVAVVGALAVAGIRAEVLAATGPAGGGDNAR